MKGENVKETDVIVGGAGRGGLRSRYDRHMRHFGQYKGKKTINASERS
jgi:hypothetical protein